MKCLVIRATGLFPAVIVFVALMIGIPETAAGQAQGSTKGVEHRVTQLEAEITSLQGTITDLQQTIKFLQQTMAQLQNAGGMVWVPVDCSSGQSINDVLVANRNRRLYISFSGACPEVLNIRWGNVVVEGTNPSDSVLGVLMYSSQGISLLNMTIVGGISTNSNASFSLDNVVLNGEGGGGMKGGSVISLYSSRAKISGSTIQGGMYGINVGSRGYVSVTESRILNNSAQGVNLENSSADLERTIIDGSGFGVHAHLSSSVTLSGAQITNNSNGAIYLGANSTAYLSVNSIPGGEPSPTVIRSNRSGIIAHQSSSVDLRGVIIENNQGDGVSLWSGSSVTMSGQDMANVIRGNQGNGIFAADTSLVEPATSGDKISITGNSGFGIYCVGPPSVSQLTNGPALTTVSVFGNVMGQSNCPGFQN